MPNRQPNFTHRSSNQSGNYIFQDAYPAGLFAGLVLTVGFAIFRFLSLTSLNFEMALGSIVTRTVGAGTWIFGLFLQLFISGGIATIYAYIFEKLGRRASGSIGAAFGVLQWAIVGYLMGALPALHDSIDLFRVPHPLLANELQVPGYFALQLGMPSAICLFVLHVLYGWTVGTLCSRKQNRRMTQVKQKPASQIKSAA